MKLDRAGQSALLKLAQVDLEIEQIKVEIAKAIGSKELTDASALLSQYSGEVIAARTKYENLNMESRKADDNLHMVEERIARDLERLNQTSSPKDAQAMQSEIESLTLRKAELEEVEDASDLPLSAHPDAHSVETIGGLVTMIAGRVPSKGERVRFLSNVEFEILDADPRRIKKVLIRTILEESKS
jgi:chromosome segregation ATPase